MRQKTLKTIFRRLYRAFGPQHWWPGDTPFEIAVGAILTQNTNWGNVEKAVENLKGRNALSAKKIHEMPLRELSSLIRPAGYYNVKARRLKSFTDFLMRGYGGSIGKMKGKRTATLREDLLAVNGIGPETADSILLYALEKPVFVIDAYTRRALSRHGITGGKEPYEGLRKVFEDALKPDVAMFNEFHALFVRLGKTYCRPRPLCGECPLYGL